MRVQTIILPSHTVTTQNACQISVSSNALEFSWAIQNSFGKLSSTSLQLTEWMSGHEHSRGKTYQMKYEPKKTFCHYCIVVAIIIISFMEIPKK